MTDTPTPDEVDDIVNGPKRKVRARDAGLGLLCAVVAVALFLLCVYALVFVVGAAWKAATS